MSVAGEKEDLALHMKPGFVALFAFMFAVGLGALWEIFEFAIDSLFGPEPMSFEDREVFIFGVDLGGVRADFYEGIRPMAAEWLGSPCSRYDGGTEAET